MDSRTAEFVARYRAIGLGGTPCAEAEVSALERDLQVRLPAAYRAMLLVMGRVPDERFAGTDLSLADLPEVQRGARELLEDHGLLSATGRPLALPPSAFVFLSHQGYQFMYFMADGGSEDPAVFHHLQGELAPSVAAPRFSGWLGNWLADS